MIEININDEISEYYGINETMIAEKLSALTPGEEVVIKINSPGGSVYAGIAIFNLIRETAKTHPVTVKVTGVAASMASYIALAGRTASKENKIIVSENSIWLIHDPWQIVMGNYKELQRAADYMERLAAMFSSTYAYVSGKTEKETRALMDVETFLIGQEIIEHGFANTFEQINQTEGEPLETDHNSLIINAKLRIDKAVEKLRPSSKQDFEKAAALIVNPLLRADKAPGMNRGFETTPGGNAGGVSLQNQITEKSEGDKMNREELKAKFPDVFAAVYGEGKEAGIKEERERAEAHLTLGEDSGNMKIAAQFIREGETIMSNKVQAAYLSARMNSGAINARNEDNPPPITGAESSGGAADDAAMEAAWEKGISGKDLQGVR
jgi:ATP-dependent protease ClpP protease subunit